MNQIRLVGVSKEFLRSNRNPLLSCWASWRGASKSERFWALDGIDLTISGPGKRVGILGNNGSGKTTLLRIIAGITRPTRGSVLVNGRVVPLLELGVGMEQHLTGRENIYLNGVVFGMSRKEVRQKFDSIVEFAGIPDFLNMPLKHYSSGMIARLCFSVAIHVDRDILLVDEVWGVTDLEFQAKSLERIRQLQEKGVTTLIVSHDLELVSQLTDEVLWLKSGRIAALGPTDSILKAYQTTTTDLDLYPIYA